MSFYKNRVTAFWWTVAAVLLLSASPAWGAGLLVADGGFGGVLEIEEHDVRVTVDNGIAVTEVTQVFRNTENRVVEALYTFPVPKGASVSGFSMWIEGKEMVGEVLEKERAREIYNSYKRVQRDPGLLEQVDYKTFEMRIFPIAAGAEQRVMVTYYQELSTDAGWSTWVYPLATVSRPGVDARVRGRFALDFDARSEIPIVQVESPSHGDDLVVARHTNSYVQASLEASGGDLSRDVVIAFEAERPRTGFDLVTSRPDGEDGYFQLSLTAGEELADELGGMDYVFLLDVSGSMGESGKLALSRDSLSAFIGALGEDDRFEVMTFNIAPTPLFQRLSETDEGALRRAAEFFDEQRARGGTILRPAMEAAYRYKSPDRPLNVVVLSDGMTEQSERAELLALIDRRPAGTRVFSIGVGNEVDRPLLEQLAEDAGGLAAFISRGADFDRQARAFRQKLMRPAATELELTFDGGDVYDVEPAKLPSLYWGSPLRIYGRYRDAGPVTLRLTGAVGGEMLDKELTIELPADPGGRPEIERMWAWHRVRSLQRQADRRGSRKEVIDEIVRLGEAYSIATEYTSFLVLENDAEYRRWSLERRNAQRIERDRRRQQELRDELEALRRDTAAGLGPVDPEAKQKIAQARPASPQRAFRNSTPANPPPTTSSSSDSNGWDLDLGGGALDPWTVMLLVLITGAAGWTLRRRPSRGPR
ncbi:MAG: MprA protease, GlyGly-CTERM protein-sorting domain-containing form [Acidobacteriota bacterium]